MIRSRLNATVRSLVGRLPKRLQWITLARPPRRQVAALPIRTETDGSQHALLITSRGSRGFIIPKGWPMPALQDYEAAAVEAKEEAGVIGRIEERPLGTYRYRKRGTPDVIAVDVYVLHVRRQLKRWREKGQRRRVWLSVEDAANRVDEPGLVPLIRQLAAAIETEDGRALGQGVPSALPRDHLS